MLIRTSYIVASFLLVGIALLVMGWTFGRIPTHAEYCETNQYTGHKECAPYHVALIALWQIGKFFDYISAPLTAFATVAIGWFTYTLRNSTNRLWEAGERQFQLEGPFLHPVFEPNMFARNLKVRPIIPDQPAMQHAPIFPEVRFRIRNVGRSPALLASIAATLEHWTELPKQPRVDFLKSYAVEPVVDPGETTNETFTKRIVIPIDDVAFESLRVSGSRLFFYGESDFSDLLGNSYIETFCFAYDFNADRFVRWGSAYNKRTRKEPDAS